MFSETTPMTREQLLAEANQLIRSHEDYMQGMLAHDVEQKGNVLVFRGEFFLDDDGLPTAKSTAAFNMFKYLAHTLSEKYHLAD